MFQPDLFLSIRTAVIVIHLEIIMNQINHIALKYRLWKISEGKPHHGLCYRAAKKDVCQLFCDTKKSCKLLGQQKDWDLKVKKKTLVVMRYYNSCYPFNCAWMICLVWRNEMSLLPRQIGFIVKLLRVMYFPIWSKSLKVPNS